MAAGKLYRADLAELLGIKVDSLQRARPPAPDGHDLEAGHARPYWHRETVKAWIATRPGRGRWGKRSAPNVTRDTPGTRASR